MGFFSRPSASDPVKDALLGAMKSVSLFSDQNLDYSSGYCCLVSTSGGVTGRLARYLSVGKYHAGVTLSYSASSGTLRLSVTYDPTTNSAKKKQEIDVMLPSTSFSAYTTNPGPTTDLVLSLEAKVSPSNLASTAKKMAEDGAAIIQMAG